MTKTTDDEPRDAPEPEAEAEAPPQPEAEAEQPKANSSARPMPDEWRAIAKYAGDVAFISAMLLEVKDIASVMLLLATMRGQYVPRIGRAPPQVINPTRAKFIKLIVEHAAAACLRSR